MKILHYTIGLPPQRHGGSVLVAYDLMKAQSRNGESVIALKCGDTLLRYGKTDIIFNNNIEGIPVYSLTNPLTPTLIYGTKSPKSQIRDITIDYESIKKFIKSNEIDILHLHTLQGLHKEIVEFFKSLGVKIVYTTHDFHGLCAHYNLINEKGEICKGVTPEACMRCNANEPSDFFLRIANSTLYHFFKSLGIIRIKSRLNIRSLKNNKNKKDLSTTNNIGQNRLIADYKDLITYYKEYFNLIDKFHFNSSQTKKVFKTFLPWTDGKVIPVITQSIMDKRSPLTPKSILQFGFVGSLNDYKGFPLLKEVLRELSDEGYDNFRLQVFSGNYLGVDPDCSKIEYKPSYTPSTITETFYNLDCLIVPSKWYETFSLVTLEALSHGRPVIISAHVGAKDIITNITPEFIFSTKEELKNLIKSTLDNPQILVEINKKILSTSWNWSLGDNAKIITEYYKE